MPYNKSEKRRDNRSGNYNKSEKGRAKQKLSYQVKEVKRILTTSIPQENKQNQKTTPKEIQEPIKKTTITPKPEIVKKEKKPIIKVEKISKPPAYPQKKSSSIAVPKVPSSDVGIVTKVMALQPHKDLPSLFFKFFNYKLLIGGVFVLVILATRIKFPAIIFVGFLAYVGYHVFAAMNKIKFRANKIEFMDDNSLILYFYKSEIYYRKAIPREEFVCQISLSPQKNKSDKKIEASLKLGNRRDQIVIYDDFPQLLRCYFDILQAMPEKKITQQEYVKLSNVKGKMERKNEQLINAIRARYEKRI